GFRIRPVEGAAAAAAQARHRPARPVVGLHPLQLPEHGAIPVSSTKEHAATKLAPLPRGDRNENPTGITLSALLWADFRTPDRNPVEQGFWAVAVHRFGNWRMSFRVKILRAPLTILYFVLFKLVEVLAGICLPYTVKLGRRVRIWHFGGMVLHAR